LGGVVATELIVGAAVRGPEVDVFVTSVGLYAECDTDESARGVGCPGAGWPARSTSIVPSRKETLLRTANDVAFAASGVALTWTALLPLKLVCAIVTFFPVSC